MVRLRQSYHMFELTSDCNRTICFRSKNMVRIKLAYHIFFGTLEEFYKDNSKTFSLEILLILLSKRTIFHRSFTKKSSNDSKTNSVKNWFYKILTFGHKIDNI